MSSISDDPTARWPERTRPTGVHARGEIPGWLASLLLHLLFVSLLLLLIRHASQPPHALHQLVPVNIVQLSENMTSPPNERKAVVPQQSAVAKRLPRHSAPIAIAPARNLAPPDSLEVQLRALSRMRESQTNLPELDNAGASNVDATSDDAAFGAGAAYSVRDYIRNQVERRWSLNLSRLGGSNFTVRIHVVVSRNGAVTKADIVDRARFANDAAWRDVALSARNAVLLSSPIVLPAGQRAVPLEMTLRLDPRDAVR